MPFDTAAFKLKMADATLADAHIQRDAAVLRTALRAGGDPNKIGANGMIPLMSVVLQGWIEGAQILWPATSDAARSLRDRGGHSLLDAAAVGGHLAMVRFVIGSLGDKAARAIAREASPRGDTALMQAAGRAHFDVLAELLPLSDPEHLSADGDSALRLAVQAGSIECVRALLAVLPPEAVETPQNGSPLDAAIDDGYDPIVDELALRACAATQAKTLAEHGRRLDLPRLRERLAAAERGELLAALPALEGSGLGDAAGDSAASRAAPRL
jgi:ankyrin repeat protein